MNQALPLSVFIAGLMSAAVEWANLPLPINAPSS